MTEILRRQGHASESTTICVCRMTDARMSVNVFVMEKDLTSLNWIDARRFEKNTVELSSYHGRPTDHWRQQHVVCVTRRIEKKTIRRDELRWFSDCKKIRRAHSVRVCEWVWRYALGEVDVGSDNEIVWGESQTRASDLEDEGRTGFSTSEEERPNSADTTLELDTNLYRSFDFRRVTNDNRTSSESHGFASFVVDVVSDSRYVATIRIWTELKLIYIFPFYFATNEKGLVWNHEFRSLDKSFDESLINIRYASCQVGSNKNGYGKHVLRMRRRETPLKIQDIPTDDQT